MTDLSGKAHKWYYQVELAKRKPNMTGGKNPAVFFGNGHTSRDRLRPLCQLRLFENQPTDDAHAQNRNTRPLKIGAD